MSTTPFLSMEHLKKSFDNTEVLKDINIQVTKGEFIVLLGPSGCGKTTLMRIIAGLIDADAGTVVLEDKDLSRIPTHEREIGFVFQRYALFPHMSVRENIIYGLKIRKRSKETIAKNLKEVVDLLELNGLENRKISEISGGQQQRVALARALIIKPKLLLLDEPLSNLDAKLRSSVRVKIVEIQKQLGITTVMVTHDQIEAMTMGDRIVLMNNGKIQQSGTPKELYVNPKDKFVSEFIGTPKINMLPIHYDRVRQEWRVPNTNNKIQSDEMAKWLMVDSYSSLESGEYLLGIRPELIHITDEGQFSGIITFIEDCGADAYIYIRIGSDNLITRINSNENRWNLQEKITFTFLNKTIYLFDFEGNRII